LLKSFCDFFSPSIEKPIYDRYVDATLLACNGSRSRDVLSPQMQMQLNDGLPVARWLADQIPKGSALLDVFSGLASKPGPLVLADHVSKLTTVNNDPAIQAILDQMVITLNLRERVDMIFKTLGSSDIGFLPRSNHVTLVSTGLATPPQYRGNHAFFPGMTRLGLPQDLNLLQVLPLLGGDSGQRLYLVEPHDQRVIEQVSRYVRSELSRSGTGWTVAKDWELLGSKHHIGAVFERE